MTRIFLLHLIAILISIPVLSALAPAQTLRIAAYNIDADTGGAVGSMGGPDAGPGLETVLEGIGKVNLSDNGLAHAQPFDVLGLTELDQSSGSTPSSTLSFIVGNLNATYGANTYAYDTFNDPTTGGTGGGPSGLIYNTKTIIDLGSGTLSAASSSGAPRAPMQYHLQPVGYPSSMAFYVDLSHTKSGADSSGSTTNADRRNAEATTLANNAATLGSTAHIISMGDFNIADNGSTESTYQTMISQFHDPADPSNTWNDVTTAERDNNPSLLSESATSVQFRDDIQFVSPAADSGSGVPGIQLDKGSISVFGNGGSTSLVNNSVNSSANSAAFSQFNDNQTDMTYRSNLLSALTTDTDHLPVVADYDIISAPEPACSTILLMTACIIMYRRSRTIRLSR